MPQRKVCLWQTLIECIITNPDKQKQDIRDLSRDTENAHKTLGNIFDLETVQERKEMANLFSEMAHKAIGDLTLKISPDEKRALNIAAGAITSYLGSGDYLSGAVGVSVTEAMQNILKDVKDPTVKEILVGIASATAGRMASLQVESVVASAINAEIFNHLTHEQQEKLQKALEEAGNNPEKITAILEYFIGLSLGNIQFNPEGGEYMEPGTINALNGILKLGDCGVKFEVNEEFGLHENLKAARASLDLYHILKYTPDLFGDIVITVTTKGAGTAIKD